MSSMDLGIDLSKSNQSLDLFKSKLGESKALFQEVKASASSFSKLAGSIEGSSQKAITLASNTASLADKLGIINLDSQTKEQFSALANSVSDTKNKALAFANETKQLVDDISGLKDAGKNTMAAVASATTNTFDSVAKLKNITNQASLENYAYSQGIVKSGQKLTGFKKIQAQVGLAMSTGGEIADNFKNGVAAVGQSWNKFTAQAGKVKNQAIAVKSSFSDLAGSYSQTKDNLLNLGTSLKDSFANIKGNIGNTINSFKNFGSEAMNNLNNIKASFGQLKKLSNDNAVATYAYEQGIATAGQELTTFQRIQAQASMALASGKDIVGSFSTAFTSLGTQWGNLQSSYQSIKAGVLQVGESYQAVKDSLGPLKDNLLKFGANLKSVASTSLTFAKNFGTSAMQAISSFASSIISTVTTAFPALLSSLGGAIASAWSFTAALLANPITWVVAGVVALGGAIFALWKNWDQVTAWISEKWSAFVNLIKAGAAWVKEKFANLFPQIKLPALPDLVGAIKGKLSAAIDFVKNNPFKIFRFLVPAVNLPEILNGIYEKARTWLASNVGLELPEFKLPSIEEVFNKITEKIQWLMDKIKNFNIGNLLKSGIEGGKKAATEAIGNLTSKIRSFLPFSDAKEGPLSDLSQSGKALVGTVVKGVDKSKEDISKPLSNKLTTAKEALAKTDFKISSQDSKVTNRSKLTKKTQEITKQQGNGSVAVSGLLQQINQKLEQIISNTINLGNLSQQLANFTINKQQGAKKKPTNIVDQGVNFLNTNPNPLFLENLSQYPGQGMKLAAPDSKITGVNNPPTTLEKSKNASPKVNNITINVSGVAKAQEVAVAIREELDKYFSEEASRVLA